MEFFVPFIVAVAVILIAPMLLQRFGVPGVVAILISGIIIGPHGLNLIAKIVEMEGGDLDAVMYTFSTLGVLGAIFLMSLAGMEVSPRFIKKEWKSILIFAALSAGFPAVVGYFIGIYVGLMPLHAVFLASLFASHSVALVFATVKEVRLLGTRLGIIILKSTVFTDLVSLIMIGVVIQIVAQEETHVLVENPVYFLKYMHVHMDIWALLVVSVLGTIVFLLGSIYLMRYLAHHTFKRFSPRDPKRLTAIFLLIILIAFIGEVIGLHVIIGAYIAGLAIADSWGMEEEGRILHHRLNSLGYGIFVPLFFLVLGMNTNLSMLFLAPEYIKTIIVLAIGLIGSKIVSGYIALRVIGFKGKESLFGAWVTIPQLSATLAAAQMGMASGIIPDFVFASIIIISIATTILRPMGSKLIKRILHIRLPDIEEGLKDFIYSLEGEERVPLYEQVIEEAVIEATLEDEEDLEEEFVGEEIILSPMDEEEEWEGGKSL